MKTTLAIVCSLLLAGTPVVLAQAAGADVVRVAHASCRCGKACCAAPASPASQPSPATPAPAPAQNQLLTFAPAALAWSLPDTPTLESGTSTASPLAAMGAPLYARNCARLI